MLSRKVFTLSRRIVCENARMLSILHNSPKITTLQRNHLTSCLTSQQEPNFTMQKRFKQTKKKNQKHKADSDDEDESDEEELNLADTPMGKGSKMIDVRIPSLRLDTVAKAGLGVSRNKIDEEFYKSNIRLNGEKVFKKSVPVEVGDEIDIVLHQSTTNPQHLVINRVSLINAKSGSDLIHVKLLREKNLTVENYEEPWKNSVEPA